MQTSVFQFGQRIDGHDIPVLNERAVRAAAGLLFLLAIVAFMNAWLLGKFQPTRVFVLAFLADFTLRLFVHPRYAPSLILGQWLVRRQQPVAAMYEYKEAIQLNPDFLDKKTKQFQGKKIKVTVEEAMAAIESGLRKDPDDSKLKQDQKTLYFMKRKLAGSCG